MALPISKKRKVIQRFFCEFVKIFQNQTQINTDWMEYCGKFLIYLVKIVLEVGIANVHAPIH